MNGMKIYILTDNETCSPGILRARLEPLIELGDWWILFDWDDGCHRRNAEMMGLDLHKIDYAVISHGHYDHGGGFDFLEKTPAAPVYVREKCLSRMSRIAETTGFSTSGSRCLLMRKIKNALF